MKVDGNFDEKMTCGFTSDMRGLVNCTGALKNFKICTLIHICPKYITLS